VPEGFRLAPINDRYVLSWVNWRVRRTKFPFWLCFVVAPGMLIFTTVVTALVVHFGLMGFLGWLVFLFGTLTLCLPMAPASLLFRESIIISASRFTYETKMPLKGSFTLQPDDIKKVALKHEKRNSQMADEKISEVLCAVHVESPEKWLATSRFARTLFYMMRNLVPFGQLWIRMPKTVTGWAPGPLWTPLVNAQVFAVLRHFISRMQWRTEFELDAEGQRLLEEGSYPIVDQLAPLDALKLVHDWKETLVDQPQAKPR